MYAPWIEAILGGPPPEERHATYSACAMCEPTNASTMTAVLTTFDPATKCCTYVPTLPNFLVGMILDEDDPAAEPGRRSVERRIVRGSGVTPLGLQAEPQFALIYKHAGSDAFGRSPGMRCPHYLPADGGCGIWRHRNAVCATWFCKHERGAVGKRFWDALRQLLTLAERHLALWAAAELGEGLGGLASALVSYYATLPASLEHRWSSRWADRAGDFYRESANLVRPLAWTAVREIAGPELVLVEGTLRAAWEALEGASVPLPYLRFGAVSSFRRADGRRAMLGYSPLDLPILRESLARELDRFDGRRPTREVCEELTRETGAPIEPELLRLIEFGILGPVEELEEVAQ
jgi:hypothetical protein